jgi:hypothetical protein
MTQRFSCRLDKITNNLTKRIVLFSVSNRVGSDSSGTCNIISKDRYSVDPASSRLET